MEIKDFVAQSMTRTRTRTLEILQSLSQEQVIWIPAPRCNPIGFLLWHVIRTEDRNFNIFIARGKEVWESEGWYQKFGLPLKGTGNGWSEEDAASFNCPPLADLLDYTARVRESALEALKGLDPARLTEAPNPDRPGVTIANMLQIASGHESHHQGVMDYLLGLMQRTQRA